MIWSLNNAYIHSFTHSVALPLRFSAFVYQFDIHLHSVSFRKVINEKTDINNYLSLLLCDDPKVEAQSLNGDRGFVFAFMIHNLNAEGLQALALKAQAHPLLQGYQIHASDERNFLLPSPLVGGSIFCILFCIPSVLVCIEILTGFVI